MHNTHNSINAQALEMQKRPQSGRFKHHLILSYLRSDTDGLARDTCDLAAIDTEIVQFAGGHTAEFVYGLTIFTPVIEGACYVHDITLS